jgi:hypothetical protein
MLWNVVVCTIRAPPLKRPIVDLASGMSYHPLYVGFDHRRLPRDPEPATLRGCGMAAFPRLNKTRISSKMTKNYWVTRN